MLDFSCYIFTYVLVPLTTFYLITSWISFLFFEHTYVPDNTQQRILITGCASGIGKATTLAALQNGDAVLGFDLHDNIPSNYFENTINNLHKNFVYYQCDVTSSKSIQSIADTIKQPIHAIVSCAGINRGGPIIETNPKEMELVLQVNVMGSVNLTKSFYPLLSPNGRMIFISSEVGWSSVTSAFNVPYSMSKICLEAYVIGLRQEMQLLGKNNAPHIVVINPGAMQTPLLAESLKHGFVPKIDNSLYQSQMKKGYHVAKTYMDKYGQDPSMVANVVVKAVHDVTPCKRYLINVSLEMKVAKLLPQWMLDAATLNIMKEKTKSNEREILYPSLLLCSLWCLSNVLSISAWSGLVAGMVTGFVLYPLTNLETRNQLNGNESVVGIVKEVYAKEGMFGFYIGMVPTVIGEAVNWMVYSWLYSVFVDVVPVWLSSSSRTVWSDLVA